MPAQPGGLVAPDQIEDPGNSLMGCQPRCQLQIQGLALCQPGPLMVLIMAEDPGKHSSRSVMSRWEVCRQICATTY